MIHGGHMYYFRRCWKASPLYRSLMEEVWLSLFFLPLCQLPPLGVCPKPLATGGSLDLVGSPLEWDEVWLLNPRYLLPQCLLGLQEMYSFLPCQIVPCKHIHCRPSSPSFQGGLFQHPPCSTLFYTSRLEAGSSIHAHINLQTPNTLSSLACGATHYFSVLNFRSKVPSNML